MLSLNNRNVMLLPRDDSILLAVVCQTFSRPLYKCHYATNRRTEKEYVSAYYNY